MSYRERPRVIIADDDELVLYGARALLTSKSLVNVVATATDGASAVECIRVLHPDIAILDLKLPHMGGVDVLRIIKEEGLGTRVIFLVESISTRQIQLGISEGAWGIVLKHSPAEALCACIYRVALGEHCFASIVDDLMGREADGEDQYTKEEKLTPRELQISQLVADGMSNKAIAKCLKIMPGTVKVHLQNIYHKVGVTNRTALAMRARLL